MNERRSRGGWIAAGALGALVVLGVAWWRFSANSVVVPRVTTPASNAPIETVEPALGAPDEKRVEQPDSKPIAAPNEPAPTATSTSHEAKQIAFWGRALDEETGAPVVGADIVRVSGTHHRSSGRSAPKPEVKTTSDANGLFELQFSAEYGAHASLNAAGYSAAVFAFDELHATAERAFVVRLRRAAEVEVHALHVLSGPVADAKVRLWTNTYELAQPPGAFVFGVDPEWRATTDRAGVAHLGNLPSDVPLEIELTPADGSPATQFDDVVLARGEKRVIELKLGGNSRVSGVLLDERGEPVAAQLLWLTNHTLGANAHTTSERVLFYTSDGQGARSKTKTDEHGHFEINDVPRGRWWIGPEAEYRAFNEPDERALCAVATCIEVDGVNPVELTLRSQRGLFITVKVLDPSGKAVSAPVMALPLGDLGGFISGSHAHGDISAIGPLMPGKYMISADGVDGACNSEQVLVDAGARDVELRLRAGAQIRGTTIDASTRAPLRCTVYASRAQDEYYSGTDSDGTFDLGGIPAGRYDLCATTLDGRCCVVRGVVASNSGESTSVELALQPAARLHVRYDGPEQYSQFMVFDGDTIVAADGLHTHTTAVHTVPVGRLRVRMKVGRDAEQVREVDIANGEEPTVSFTFE